MMAAPDFFTVEEAARILRIGRTAAYLAAKRYRETDGADGLPCIAICGSLRVPRRSLEGMAGGPIDGAPASTASLGEHRDAVRSASAENIPRPRRSASASADSQRSLPFPG